MRKFFTGVILCLATTSVSAQTDNWQEKVSPLLRQQVATHRMEAQVATRGEQTETYLGALVKLAEGQNGSVLRRERAVLLDSLDGMYITLLPASRVPAMAGSQQVVAMEAHEGGHLNMDVTHITTGADKVQAGTTTTATPIPAYTGKGVVVGISDNGFDYTHPMFRDANGKSRIKKAWDIHAPNSNGYGGIGAIYSTSEEMLAAQGSKDAQGTHGTHVMGIAAGSPWTAKTYDGKEVTYRGLAYEADIVAATSCVLTRNEDVDKQLADKLKNFLYDNDYLRDMKAKGVYTNNIPDLLSMKMAFDYASEHNMPCVVNCSWGSPNHFTDHMEVVNEFIRKLTGPGRILVTSSGNEGDSFLYSEKPADINVWTPSNVVKDPNFTFSVHCDGEFEIEIEIFKKSDTVSPDFIQPMMKSETIREYCDKGQNVYIWSWKNKQDQEMDITMKRNYVKGVTSGYDYAFTMDIPKEYYDEFFNYINIRFQSNNVIRLMGSPDRILFGETNDFNNYYTVGWPGDLDCSITVGLTSHRAYVTNINGESIFASGNQNPEGYIVNWSSCGPTLDGRLKPEITVPGYNIVSARSKLYAGNTALWTNNNKYVIARNTYDGEEREVMAQSGTSMATPVMAGIVALWLQAKPDLTREDIIATLSRTAKVLDNRLAYPNYIYGYGEADAYAGLLDILGLPTAIPALSQKLVGVTLQGHTLHIEGISSPTDVKVYNLNGQILFSTQTADGQVELPQLPAAVYAVQVGTDRSTLIRL